MMDWIRKKLEAKHQSIADEVCNLCGEPILSFEDELSLKEYEISGCCQNCQNELFTPDPFIEEESDEV